jgi:N-acetylmuramoyl-L-alanine amidase
MKLIAIDDGHGMETPGKRTPLFSGTTTYMHENEFNNAVAQMLKTNLEKCGFNTLMVAPGNTDIPLKVRTDTANNAKADLYISIHANALNGRWGEQRGVSTYHYPNSRESNLAAIIIHRQLIKGTKQKDRGVLTADFHVLRETTMPSVLVECAFMDNIEEAKLLMSDAFRRECADELTKGICEFFGVSYVEKTNVASQYEKDIRTLTSLIEINAEYWLKKKSIDPYFEGFVRKVTEKIQRDFK